MMEIERKFLLESQPEWLTDCGSKQIEQGYLAISEESEVRLRKSDDDRLLTVKGGRGESREEAEVDLPGPQFEVLWPLTSGMRVSKTRYLVPLDGGLTAEVDVYSGDLKGLLVAEVEFGSAGESHEFDSPEWFGKEVTGIPSYANQSLATFGRPHGPEVSEDRSRAYRLKTKENPADGIRRIATGRANQALDELGKVGSDGRDTAIHEVRKNLKKLRSAVRLVRSELGPAEYKRQNELYRDAGRELSGSRDSKVKVDTLDGLMKGSDDGLPAKAVAKWRHSLLAESEADAAVDDSTSAAAGKVEAGRDGIKDWTFDIHGSELVEEGLTQSYRRGRRAMKKSKKDPDPANFHDWRKRTKDLWYQLLIVRESWESLLDETADSVHDLADLLGDHHDLQVLAEDLKERNFEKPDRKELKKMITRRQRELAAEAFDLGRRIYAEKPRHFQRRITVYWEAWR